MIRFDGIYFHCTDSVDVPYDAMRFFENGRVVYVHVGSDLGTSYKSMCRLAKTIKSWFNRDYVNKGEFIPMKTLPDWYSYDDEIRTFCDEIDKASKKKSFKRSSAALAIFSKN